MHPSPLQQACQELLVQIPELEPLNHWDKGQVLAHFVQQIRSAQTMAQNLGCNSVDILDATYALVALLDEQIPQRCPTLAGQWRSALAQELFRENRAGEAFFERLEELLTQPERHGVVRIYGTCLGFGFRGKFPSQGVSELVALRKKVASYLKLQGPPLPMSITMAPVCAQGDRTSRRWPYLWPATLAVCLGMISMASIRRSLDQSSKEILRRLPQVLQPLHLS